MTCHGAFGSLLLPVVFRLHGYEGDSDALILKDLSKKDDEEAIFEVVSDDEELESVAKIFESILDDIDFTKE